MSDKNLSLIEWLRTFLSQPFDVFEITIALILGEIGRWCHGGGRLREKTGDLIICLLIFYLIYPWIPVLPPIAGIKIRPGAIAIIISLLGSHGVEKILLYFFNKKTGIDLEKITKGTKDKIE